MRNSKRKNVLQFCRYADSARPSFKIPFVQYLSGALQDRKGVLEVPGPAHLKLLQNKVFRRYDPVVASVHAFSLLPFEDLLIVRIAGTQQVDRDSLKLKTKLKASEQGIPFYPGFIERHSRLSHALAQATEVLLLH